MIGLLTSSVAGFTDKETTRGQLECIRICWAKYIFCYS